MSSSQASLHREFKASQGNISDALFQKRKVGGKGGEGGKGQGEGREGRREGKWKGRRKETGRQQHSRSTGKGNSISIKDRA